MFTRVEESEEKRKYPCLCLNQLINTLCPPCQLLYAKYQDASKSERVEILTHVNRCNKHNAHHSCRGELVQHRYERNDDDPLQGVLQTYHPVEKLIANRNCSCQARSSKYKYVKDVPVGKKTKKKEGSKGGKGGGNLPDAKAYHTNECTIDQPNQAAYTNTECKEVCGTCFLAKDAEGLNGRRVQIGCPIIGCNGVRVWRPSIGTANGFFCAMCLSLPGQERERIYRQRQLMRELATTKQATSDVTLQMEGKALEKAIKIWEDVVHKYWDSNTTGRGPDGSLFLEYPGVAKTLFDAMRQLFMDNQFSAIVSKVSRYYCAFDSLYKILHDNIYPGGCPHDCVKKIKKMGKNDETHIAGVKVCKIVFFVLVLNYIPFTSH